MLQSLHVQCQWSLECYLGYSANNVDMDKSFYWRRNSLLHKDSNPLLESTTGIALPEPRFPRALLLLCLSLHYTWNPTAGSRKNKIICDCHWTSLCLDSFPCLHSFPHLGSEGQANWKSFYRIALLLEGASACWMQQSFCFSFVDLILVYTHRPSGISKLGVSSARVWKAATASWLL